MVDVPREGNFIVPALVRRGALTLAISTDGQSPALSRRIREELEERYGEEYGDLLHLLGAVRARLLSTSKDSQANKGRFEQLVHSPLLDLVRRRDREGVERMLREEAHVSPVVDGTPTGAGASSSIEGTGRNSLCTCPPSLHNTKLPR